MCYDGNKFELFWLSLPLLLLLLIKLALLVGVFFLTFFVRLFQCLCVLLSPAGIDFLHALLVSLCCYSGV